MKRSKWHLKNYFNIISSLGTTYWVERWPCVSVTRYGNNIKGSWYLQNIKTTGSQRYAHHCPDSLRDGIQVLEKVDYNLTTFEEKQEVPNAGNHCIYWWSWGDSNPWPFECHFLKGFFENNTIASQNPCHLLSISVKLYSLFAIQSSLIF